MTTTSEILGKSLNLLRTNGWCKGLLRTEEPRPQYCAVGAVLAVEFLMTKVEMTYTTYTTAVNSSPLRVLEAIIAEQYPDRSAKSEMYTSSAWERVVYFNNHDDTDFADIERVFEKAVLAAAERDD
jgi:hypothetical protein